MSVVGYTIGDLLPQAPPMVLLDTISAHDAASITATVTIRADSPFRRGPGVPIHVGIEYMAQACAAFTGLEARLAGRQPQVGLLLGTRNFSATRSYLIPGETLSVTATELYREDNMGAFDCSIFCRREILARASLTAYQPREPIDLEALGD